MTEFISIQGHYNLIAREEEREMAPFCHSENIAMTPYSALAGGRLSKRPGETSKRLEEDAYAKFKYDTTAEADYPYYSGFNFLTLLANWLKLVCFNFPFAYFSQLFFIQPIVRVLFKDLFAKQIKARADKAHEDESNGLENERPADETEAIADVWKRMDEISEQLAHERRQRKRLQEKVERQVK